MEVRTQVELGSRNDEGTVGPAWDPGRPAKGSFGSPESEDRREQSGLNRDLSSCPPRLKCHPLKRARIPSPPSASRGSPGHFGGSLCKQKKLLWKLNVDISVPGPSIYLTELRSLGDCTGRLMSAKAPIGVLRNDLDVL